MRHVSDEGSSTDEDIRFAIAVMPPADLETLTPGRRQLVVTKEEKRRRHQLKRRRQAGARAQLLRQVLMMGGMTVE